MTEKEYLTKLNELRKLYMDICRLIEDPILVNYGTVFGWHDNHGNNPNSTEFYELNGKFEALYDKTINDDHPDTTINQSLLLWKRMMEWAAKLLDFCERAMSMEEYGKVFKQGQEGYKYDAQAWEKIKLAHRMEKILDVRYSNDLKGIELGLITTPDDESNQNNIEDESSDNSQSYVKYSDYKLLLRRIKTLEDTIKKLKDELEVVHSQLDYLSDNLDDANDPKISNN